MMKRVLRKSRPRGLAARLRRRGFKRKRTARRSKLDRQRLRRYGRLGKLVPIKTIVEALRKRVQSGQELPGDSWWHDYERWEQQIRDKEIKPDTPPPGELTAEEKKTYRCKYLGEGKDEGGQPCRDGAILPDLDDYVLYIFDKVFSRVRNSGPTEMKTDLLFKYGCKQISRRMPGFAKVVVKRISSDIDMVGNWDAPIPADALEKPPRKGKGGRPKKGSAKPKKKKVRLVEICTVTHKQLEATLRKDLKEIVSAVTVVRRDPGEDDLIHPVSGYRPKAQKVVTSSTLQIRGRRGSRSVVAGRSVDRLLRGRVSARRSPPRRSTPRLKWQKVPGKLMQVSVGKAGLVWGVSKDHGIFKRTGSRWTRVKGAFRSLSVGGDGSVWGVNLVGNIYRHDRGRWKRVAGKLAQISVGSARHVWGVTSKDAIFKWTGRKWQGVKGRLHQVSVGYDGTVWGVNRKGEVYRYQRGWKRMPGKLFQIAVGNAHRVWGVTRSGQIYRWTGRGWNPVNGKLQFVAVSKFGNVWGTTSNHDIYRRDNRLPGGRARSPARRRVARRFPPRGRASKRSAASRRRPRGGKRRRGKRRGGLPGFARAMAAALKRDPSLKAKLIRYSRRAKMLREYRTARDKLWVDVGLAYNVPHLEGVTFHDVAKRLITFYRKKGGVRNFAQAMKKSEGKIRELGKPENLPNQKEARAEMAEHTKKRVVETRSEREVLRRKVEQWTYGYEYEQIGGLLTGSKGRRFASDYKKAESVALKAFWDDCEELQAICQAPKSRREKDACTTCAVQALKERCLDGKDERGQCKGAHKVELFNYIVKPQKWRTEISPRGHNTFFHWLNLEIVKEMYDARFHRGDRVLNTEWFKAGIVENLIARQFFPGDKGARPTLTKSQKETLKKIKLPIKGEETSNEGKRNFDSLPITTWQRCILFNPLHGTGPGQRSDRCDRQDGKPLRESFKKGEPIPWHRSRMFTMVLGDSWVRGHFEKIQQFWRTWCKVNSRKKKHDVCTGTEKRWSRPLAKAFFKRGAAGTGGTDRNKRLGDTGDAIGGAVGPIVGKLLGILLKAAGMYETMKTLAKAAGLTPEQSSDCEDAEYRKEVMKLAAKQDHKRGCLLKVFAKNFANVLESIIVMLGNKLVDWGVDLLRTALQGVKSALLSAAGSVPFAGGFLATLVDIGWELIMNFGAKMLLKGFVVAKLPEWLKVRELAKYSWEKLLANPIVQVVAGIILQLIDAAVTYGDKGWLAVGADTVLSTIELALQRTKPPQYFWIRALHYAKKEMRRSSSGPGDEDLEGQILLVAKSMVGGFGEAIARNMRDPAKTSFLNAVDDIKALLSKGGVSNLVRQISADPVGFLTKFIVKKIGPVVIPVITSLVSMPEWAKNMLNNIAGGLSETLDDIEKGRLKAKNLIARIINVFEPEGTRCEERILCRLLMKLPIGDEALQQMIIKGFTGLVSVLRDIDRIPAALKKPWDIVKAVVEVTGDYLKSKVADLIQAPKLAPEKALLSSAVGAILDVLGNEQVRNRLFPSRGPNAKAILGKLAEILKPYAVARLRGLLAGTGLEDLVGSAAEALFGPSGPFVKGEGFFRDLGKLLVRHGSAIASKALGAVKGIVIAQVSRLGDGPAGRIIAGLTKGLMGSLSSGMGGKGGIQTLLRKGAAGALKLARDALRPLLDAIAPAPGPRSQASPLNTLLRSVLGGVLDFFGDERSLQGLVKRGVGALGGLAKRVATGLRDTVKSLVGGAVRDRDLRSLAQDGVDGFFSILSDPSQLGRFSGEKVLDLLKVVGQRVFGYVQGKILALVSRSQLGPARAALQGLLTSVLDEVKRMIGDPGRLRSLVEGGAGALLGRVAQLFRKPLQNLVNAVVPSSVRSAIGAIIEKVTGFFADAGRLASLTVDKVLGQIGPTVKSALEGILRSVVPENAWAQLQGAIAKIQAALANPAGLLQQAGAAARKAIDEVIAAVLFRIPDGGLRNLASSLVALVRDLVTSGGAGDKLRKSAGALLRRLVSAGVDYLGGLIPSGPVRRIVRAAVDGLRGLLSGKGGLARSLAQRASALLPGLKRSLVRLIGEAINRAIPDRQVAGMLGGLAGEVVGLVGDPDRWQQLKKEGVGYLLSRLLPVARDFVSGALGRQAGNVLRGVVDGLFNAASDLLSNPKRIAAFAKNAVSNLVSIGVRSVQPVVLNLVRQATGNEGIVTFLRDAMSEVKQMLTDPTKLGDFLRLKAPQAIGKLIGKARDLVQGLVGSAIRDKGLRTLAQEGIQAVLEFVKSAVSGGGRNLGAAVKKILAKLIPAIGRLAKEKLLALFPHHLKGLKQVLGRGFDKLISFGTDLIRTGKASWQKLVGDGGRLFGTLVKAVLPLLKGPITKAIGYQPLRGLMTRLLDAVANLLEDPPALVRSFKSAKAAMRKLLPELEKVLGPFASDVLVKPLPRGIGRNIVAAIVDTGRGFLKDPSKLESFIRNAGKKPKALVKGVLEGLIPPMLKPVRSKTLKTILEKGLKMLLQQVAR